MAAGFNTEQGLEEIFGQSFRHDDDISEEGDVVDEEEDSEREKLREFLVKYEGTGRFDIKEFFIAKSLDALLSIIEQFKHLTLDQMVRFTFH